MTAPKTNERPGTRATLRQFPMSASKARVVLDLIRGEDVQSAREILAGTTREAARVVDKVLASAVANAVNNDGLAAEELYVSACYADEGITMKRFSPRARGRAGRIRKRTCHITVIVSRLDDEALERLRAAAGTSVLGLAVVGWCAGWLALAITVVLLGAAGPLYRRAGRRAEAAQVAVRERRERLEARQLEVLRHVPELRGVGAVDYGARELGALSDREHEVALSAIRVALESSAVTEFLSGVSVGLVAMVVGFALLGGRVSLGAALVAVLVTGELYVQVRRYGVEFHRRENATTALARLGGLAVPNPTSAGVGAAVRARALVTEARPEPVDLALDEGGTLLVTGPSGSGKTTLLETLLGWRPPVAGALDLGAGPVAVVTPTTALLSTSLRENLTLGRAVEDGDVRALLGALELEGERFSDLDAPLLADGRGLSTGERVRVVLARGLIAGARLVVLDDVGGVLDERARAATRAVLARPGGPAVLEATSGVAVLEDAARLALEP